MITIEKNVPMPGSTKTSPERVELAAAFRSMEIGDSVVVAGHPAKIARAAKDAGVFTEIRGHYDATGKRIGFRAWRVAARSKKSIATSLSRRNHSARLKGLTPMPKAA
jgi:hypothetical protein